LGEDRVIDHCHLTGKFRGAAHTKCNRNYKIPNFIPLFFHNLSGYDSHLFINKLKTSLPLPTHGFFKWMNGDESENWRNMSNCEGCILEVALEYPKELHDLYNHYPLAPENTIPRGSKVRKIIPNLNNKEKYIVHHQTLKLYESLGLKVTKVQKGIKILRESMGKTLHR